VGREGREGLERQEGREGTVLLLCLAAFLFYSAIGLASHRSLHTNAFDLSVFDYALWTTAADGPVAYVPMFRHSLLAQHFMPTLLLLSPLARIFDSPAYLIVVQALFHAIAAFLLYRLARRHAGSWVALALTAAFLFSRRAHSAATSVFYIESLVPLLVFGALLAWSSRRLALYGVLLVLALGCKEDVALYFGAFGVLLALRRSDRTLGLATAAVSIVWVLAAVTIAIPSWRDLYGLNAVNPFFEARYGSAATTAARIVSFDALARIFTVFSATGFMAAAAPAWAAIAMPGMLVNLAAAPGSLQAALLGHYLWPIVPWLFVAAARGAGRIEAALGDRGRWLPLAIVAVALIDLPLPRAIVRTPWRQTSAAREAIEQLTAVPAGANVVAQPNLIPHLPRRLQMHSLGVYTAGQPEADFVVLTTEGDLWPFAKGELAKRIAEYDADARFERLTAGPAYVYRRR
jgi:uncharacterized membrane protein